MVMIMQHCEYTKNHGILYFKMVSFMFSEFNLYKNCKKKKFLRTLIIPWREKSTGKPLKPTIISSIFYSICGENSFEVN